MLDVAFDRAESVLALFDALDISVEAAFTAVTVLLPVFAGDLLSVINVACCGWFPLLSAVCSVAFCALPVGDLPVCALPGCTTLPGGIWIDASLRTDGL